METPQIPHFSRVILTAIWHLIQEAARGTTEGRNAIRTLRQYDNHTQAPENLLCIIWNAAWSDLCLRPLMIREFVPPFNELAAVVLLYTVPEFACCTVMGNNAVDNAIKKLTDAPKYPVGVPAEIICWDIIDRVSKPVLQTIWDAAWSKPENRNTLFELFKEYHFEG